VFWSKSATAQKQFVIHMYSRFFDFQANATFFNFAANQIFCAVNPLPILEIQIKPFYLGWLCDAMTEMFKKYV
jgi:hypothetical protein